MHTFTEENYLKTIYKLSTEGNKPVSTNAIADVLNTKASSVTDMIKKLSEKSLVNYKRYQGVTLTEEGRSVAVNTIRKHRLWEVFLVEHLNFKWDEVHPIAEELEHINSEELILRLEKFLGYPKYDPHGDPIPDKDGQVVHHKDLVMADLKKGDHCIIVGVKEHAPSFLQYLEQQHLLLGTKVKVLRVFDFDSSMELEIDGAGRSVSNQVCKNLYIIKENA